MNFLICCVLIVAVCLFVRRFFAGEIKETIRPDGLRIITARPLKLFFTKKVMLSVTARLGGAHDPDNHLGIAHFLEHTVFQGTTTRSREDIKRDLDRYCIKGGHNAYTSYLRTQFFGIAALINFEEMASVILDVFCNPIFPEDRVENERGPILSELLGRMDDENDIVYDGLRKMLYSKGSGPAREIVGTQETIATITKTSLVEAHRRYYAPRNSEIIVSGNVSHEEVLRIVDQYFPVREDPGRKNTMVWADESGIKPAIGREVVKKGPRKSAVVCMGVKVSAIRTTREALITDILSTQISRMLHEEIREKNGFAYYAFATVSRGEPLYCTIFMGSGVKFENLEIVEAMMKKVGLRDPLQKDLFDEIKRQLIATYSVALETSREWNEFIHREIMKGMSCQEVRGIIHGSEKLLDSITFEDVVKMREELLREERLATFILTKE